MEAFLYDRTSNLLFLVWVQLYIEIQRFIFGCSGQKSRCLVSFLIAKSGYTMSVQIDPVILFGILGSYHFPYIWKNPQKTHKIEKIKKKNNIFLNWESLK